MRAVLLKEEFFTVTLQVNFLPQSVAVILTVPAFFPVTTPFDDTVAIFVLEDFQVGLAVVPVSLIVVVLPLYISALDLLIFTYCNPATVVKDLLSPEPVMILPDDFL